MGEESKDYIPHSHNTAANPAPLAENDLSLMKNCDCPTFEQSCGWQKFCPKKLQRLNNPKWFLFFLIVFSIAQAMIINGFTNVGLSTLEKQFKLSSKQSAMIIAAKEISSVILIAALSFYGSFGSKPKYLGYGAVSTALGSLLYVLPHLLIGNYIPNGISNSVITRELCSDVPLNSTVSEARCELLASSDWYYLFVFIIAKLLIGAGTAPLFTLGAAYIDENVKPKVSPVYLGVWYVSTSFGPGIGFVAGGSLLNVYVDLIQPPGVDLKPEDPRWIGAWWLGHFFGGVLILLSSCALLAYPRSMPGAKEMRMQAIREGAVRPEDVRLQGKFKDIFPATLTLLKNPTFIFNTLALAAGTIVSTGLGPFVVTYLKAQFGVSDMKAGVASGISLIPGTAGGIFVGSYLMKRITGRRTCQKAARYCFTFQLIAILSVSSFLIPGCKSPIMAGLDKPYHNGTIGFNNVTSYCNLHCSCNDIQYEPVCGIDNLTYFSPCHFGCESKVSRTKYGECSCLDPVYIDSSSTENRITRIHYKYFPNHNSTHVYHENIQVHGVAGMCDRDCKNFIPFLCGIVVLLILNFINAVPNKMVVMRCVPDNERAYALGVQWIVITLLGAIPGPVLFGIFIDKSCGVWETTCHGEGNCLVYDNEKLSYSLTYAILIFQTIGALFYFISWKSINVLDQQADKANTNFAATDNQFPVDDIQSPGDVNPALLDDDSSISTLSSVPGKRTSNTTMGTQRTMLSISNIELESR